MDLTHSELKELELLLRGIVHLSNSSINYWNAKGWENSNLPKEKYIETETKKMEIAQKFLSKIESVKIDMQIK